MRNVDDPSDIRPAMTHKDPYPRLLFGDIPFRRIDPFFVQLPSPVVKELTALGARSAGRKNRLGNVQGALKGSADKDPGPGRFHGIERIVLAESLRIELDAELGCEVLGISRRVHSNGQDHHIEFFFLDSVLGGRVLQSSHSCFPGFPSLWTHSFV